MGLAVSWQSFETRRAAQAMRVSNQAAISSQRARLRAGLEHVDKDRGDRLDRSFQLIATNFGSTIAEVIGVGTKLDYYGLDQFKNLEMTDIDDPTPNRFAEPHLIPSAERWRLAEIGIDEVTGTGMEASDIEAQTRFPVWCGSVWYLDFAGTTHRRKFFYMYSKANRMLFELGPKGWNTEDEQAISRSLCGRERVRDGVSHIGSSEFTPYRTVGSTYTQTHGDNPPNGGRPGSTFEH